MGKHDVALRALVKRLAEIGGDLYTLELANEEDKSLAALINGLVGTPERKKEFYSLLNSIAFLKEHNDG